MASAFWFQSDDKPKSIDIEITFADSLGEGEMQALKVGEKDTDKVLVARYNGQLYSTGNFCSHFGVPLAGGMLFDDKVLCPAHAAGFSIITGKPERAPGLDGIPSFPVVEKAGKFFVQIPAEGLPKKETMPLSKRDNSNKTHYVIVGGGAAGLNCAETLRQSGFTGEISVISAENAVPYDRTLLSKALAVGDAKNWSLRPDNFLKDVDINYKLNSKVSSVNADTKVVSLQSGETINYDKLCIATGSNVILPKIPGLDTKNVYSLRTNDDQAAIKEAAAKATSVAIVGGSFIGSECASALKMKYKDLDVHLVVSTDVPFQASLGKEIGSMMAKEHKENGVTIHSNARANEILACPEGKARGVLLSNGTCVTADLIILGTGVSPATDFLKQGSGVALDARGGVVCDPFLQTNNKDIYAAGDICSYPYWPTGDRTRTEHWIVALDQGSFAAFNMLGKLVPYASIPFFWTRHYNKSIQYVGNGQVGYEEIHVTGDVMANKFVAYYINKKDQVVAVCG